MNLPHKPQGNSSSRSAAPALLAEGDARWATQSTRWQERQLALPWPRELLQDFCLRMAGQGMCVSQAMMLCDRRYALRQLSDAHNMDDPTLRALAVELFRHDEVRQGRNIH